MPQLAYKRILNIRMLLFGDELYETNRISFCLY